MGFYDRYNQKVSFLLLILFISFSHKAICNDETPQDCPKNIIKFEVAKRAIELKKNPITDNPKYGTESLQNNATKSIANKDGFFSATKSKGSSKNEYNYVVVGVPDEHNLKISIIDGERDTPENVSASQSVRNSFYRTFESKIDHTIEDIVQMFKEAAINLGPVKVKHPDQFPRVSAITLYVKEDKVFFAHSGSSRAVVFSKTSAEEDSLYASLITQSHVDESGKLTSSINYDQLPYFDIDVRTSGWITLKPGDRILLGNKTFFRNLSYEKIYEIIKQNDVGHLTLLNDAVRAAQLKKDSPDNGNYSFILYEHTRKPH